MSLDELMRFVDPAEAAATLAVRDGDATAVGFYLDRDRVHNTGDPEELSSAPGPPMSPRDGPR